ncbi:MAG: hypothetical protein H8D23_37390 [Candidatus Brocadiales bacterium]|nr:hypothetical protein [Candidatus Brocadiales bacterium]
MKLLFLPMLLVFSGCASYATSSAPTPDGKNIYVTGHFQNKATIWRCPNMPGSEDCKRIDVTEK